MKTMELAEIRERIRPVIAQVAEIEPGQIDPNDDFLLTLGINSMSLLEVVVEMEKAFGITIKPERLPELTCLEKTAQLVHELLAQKA